MAADADMEEEVRSDFAAQEVHDGELITATIIRPRFEFRSGRFTNEVKRTFEVPKSYCAVCCRLLYDTERRPMKETMEKALVDFLISKGMLWPVMYYRDKNGERIQSVYGDFKGRRKRGMCQGPVVSRVVVCPCHGASGKNSIEVIKDLVSIVIKAAVSDLTVNSNRLIVQMHYRWYSSTRGGYIRVIYLLSLKTFIKQQSHSSALSWCSVNLLIRNRVKVNLPELVTISYKEGLVSTIVPIILGSSQALEELGGVKDRLILY